MNARLLMGAAIIIILFLIASTMEYNDEVARESRWFDSCMFKVELISDMDVYSRIIYCERLTGYELQDEDYP